MEGAINILILEDLATDAELMELELRRAGITFVSERVDTRSAYLQKLDEFRPDVILADYKLPSFDGLSALEISNKFCPEVPYIFVSGTIGEDFAIETLKRGATDYVLKDRLSRLAPAVKRALAEAEDRARRRQVEEMLKESEERFRSMAESAQEAIMSIDEGGNVVYWNQSAEEIFGYEAVEIVGSPVLKIVPEKLRAAHQRGMERAARSESTVIRKKIEATGRKKDGGEVPLDISISSWKTREGIYFTAITRDISDRKNAESEISQSMEKLRKITSGTIQAITHTVELRDPYTAGHQRRVAELARDIAREMGLTQEKIDAIHTAGFIHDLGKICIPSEILSKPGQLNMMEKNIIETHPRAGYDILKEIEFPWPLADIVLQHHERIDGSGYPQGRSGDLIIIEARILGVADVVEAMSSHRPYRPALGINRALQEVKEKRSKLYDRDVVDSCLQLYHEGYSLADTGTLARL